MMMMMKKESKIFFFPLTPVPTSRLQQFLKVNKKIIYNSEFFLLYIFSPSESSNKMQSSHHAPFKFSPPWNGTVLSVGETWPSQSRQFFWPNQSRFYQSETTWSNHKGKADSLFTYHVSLCVWRGMGERSWMNQEDRPWIERQNSWQQTKHATRRRKANS